MKWAFDVLSSSSYTRLTDFARVVGRACHLLTNMGVPEHAKRSAHPRVFPYPRGYTAPFEHWLSDKYNESDGNYGEFYWTAERVYKERGGFINPFCEVSGQYGNEYKSKNDGIFLFYTLAQLSDWFYSAGCFARNGNNNYQNIGEKESIIESYAPKRTPGDLREFKNHWDDGGAHAPSFAPKECRYVNIDDERGKKFRDMLLPYTIRAVAGLLYKFIIEAKVLNPDGTTEPIGSIYDQQTQLHLFNQEINGDHYTFRAEGTPGNIIVCSDYGRPSGTPANFTIRSQAKNVTFRASHEIVFKSGFSVEKGAQVSAFIISGCNRSNKEGKCSECSQEDYNPYYRR